MTVQHRQEISRHLAAFDFSGLFTSPVLGWDWPASHAVLKLAAGKGARQLSVVAEKRGVKILHCPPGPDGKLPLSDERRRIEKLVTPHAAEHLIIYTDAAQTRQVWQYAARRPGKPAALRELTWEKGKANELLFQKLASIAFTLDEEEGLDITGVVQRMTDSLDRDKVTKKFYDQFKRQKDAFQKFIRGLTDTGLQAWYTSLMLNRIMFCYFLQRQGFLDGDEHYLSTRLARVQAHMGKNQFHSFYRSFLRRLFHEGLGAKERSAELTALIGNVPYLNGGIFDEHPIERDHPDIAIPDEAFEKVFAFLDEFDWHLDDRPIASGREINPEILGYVFEKYTNQKEMGAYYTKEDITEYISKNCILPFLFQAVAGKVPAAAWDLLKADPDRYIYPAVRHGAGDSEESWRASLPEKIARGLDTTRPKLLERRADWNTPAPSSHGLPTEIWREAIARHQRCHDLRARLRAGQVTQIDDFITLNLHIRQFAQDVIECADASLLLAFFARLKELSVLDPTCGSGAFLFAALEILEPLYTACLQRARTLLADWQSAGEKHPVHEKELRRILDHAAAHPNEGYYVHKTIIVHNLYGVDIMEEAVEICKLRLFLKLAAQLQPGQAVEPLPDIDFNIRAGNTLVGYASRDEIRRAFTAHSAGGNNEQLLLGGIEHSLDDFRRIEEQAEDAARAFARFHQLQEDAKASPADFRTAKSTLLVTLQSLRDQLDRFLAGDYGKKHLVSEKAFHSWRKSHQPFHWFVEFYAIMNAGGFQVIIGNPPYVGFSAAKQGYSLRAYTTEACRNIYAYCFERAVNLLALNGELGFIVMQNIAFSDDYASLRNLLMAKSRRLTVATFDNIPDGLFSGSDKPDSQNTNKVVSQRVAICLLNRASVSNESRVYSSRFWRWNRAFRNELFPSISYSLIPSEVSRNRWPALGCDDAANVIDKFARCKKQLAELIDRRGSHFLQMGATPRYFISAVPQELNRSGLLELRFSSNSGCQEAECLLNSNAFYWFWRVMGDGFHLTREVVRMFPRLANSTESDLARLSAALSEARPDCTTKKLNKGRYCYNVNYNIKPDVMVAMDRYIAGCLGIPATVLDFIVNYDIKYRMGLGRAGDAEDEE